MIVVVLVTLTYNELNNNTNNIYHTNNKILFNKKYNIYNNDF